MKHINTAILAFMGLCMIFPLAVTFTNSFMTDNEIAVNYSSSLSVFDIADGTAQSFIKMNLVPAKVTLSQYKEILIYQPVFLALLFNSLKITLPVVIGNTAVSFLSAYGFTVWEYKHKEKIFLLYIIVMLMPIQAVLVPNFIVADFLSIKDSYLAIILPGIFSPFGAFLLRQNLRLMPEEYFEAAQVDGANSFIVLTQIVAPQMKSGAAALCMLIFIEYWNVVEQAIIFIRDYYREPLSVYLSRLNTDNASIVFAASCVYMVLPLWMLVTGQDSLKQGIELSGLK